MPDVEEHQEYNEAALQLSPVLYLQIIIRPFMMITCTHTSTVYTWQHEFLPLLQLCLMITTKCSYSLYYCNFYEMLPVIPLNTAMSHSYTLACFRKLFLLLLLTALSLHLTCRKSCKGTHTHNLVNFSQRECAHMWNYQKWENLLRELMGRLTLKLHLDPSHLVHFQAFASIPDISCSIGTL